MSGNPEVKRPPTSTGQVIAALALVASRGTGDHDAVLALAGELLDPIAGIAQGARTLMRGGEWVTADLRTEVLGLMHERARDLYDALVFYESLLRP